jgi:hypothetical protein
MAQVEDISDYSNFPPLIKLRLQSITSNEVYEKITHDMEHYYDHGKPFHLDIETKDVVNIHMIYLYRFAKFLTKMKDKTPQLLQRTTIHIYENYIFNLLYTLFTYLSRPIAPVDIVFWNSRDKEKRAIQKVHKFYP